MQPKLNIKQLQAAFQDDEQFDPNKRQNHSFYGFLTGKVNNWEKQERYKINDPNSEILLENTVFYNKDAQECFKQRSLQLFYRQKFSTEQLQASILNYTKLKSNGDKYYQQYLGKAKLRTADFCKIYNVSKQQAYGCCLALSFYTGVESERLNRDSNIELRSNSLAQQSKIKDNKKFKHVKCISYWLFMALHYIPLHWGQVTRCVNLQKGQQLLYQQGNITTWIQFSSSSYGKVTDYFNKRNTRFIIYSLSGRCIERFSNYGNESQVLFKPYTHFLILKNDKVDGKLFIYMREIFLGQSVKNILWVDDKIFDPKWENKSLMQLAILKNPFLGIIPKVSTETAIAYLKCWCGKDKKEGSFRIISDMTRENEQNGTKAGAIFLKKLESYYKNAKVLVFTSNQLKAQQYIKEFDVKLVNYKVTVVSQVALDFMKF